METGTPMTVLAPHPLDVSPLFTPLTIKGMQLPNRFVMPGMQRSWCENGGPLLRLADYYRERVELTELSLDEIEARLARREFEDSKTIIGLRDLLSSGASGG